MNTLGDRFDEVQERAAHRALALELKFGMTDVNGWQTAWGYDDGASRPRLRAARWPTSGATCARPTSACTEPRERQLLRELRGRLRRLHAARRALPGTRCRTGREEVTKRILLGPELEIFEATAGTAERLARYEAQQAAATEAGLRRRSATTCAERLVAVALGAAVVIVLLLLTASDLARLALEGERQRRAPQA